eukprot:6490793-Amphidinium_carterae.3
MEWVVLYSCGGAATYVPVAEYFKTASSCLLRIRTMTASLPLRGMGMKHSRNVPGGNVECGPGAASNVRRCCKTPSELPLLAMLPRSVLANSGGKVSLMVHVDEAGSCMVWTREPGCHPLRVFAELERHTFRRSGNVAILTWRDHRNVGTSALKPGELTE